MTAAPLLLATRGQGIAHLPGRVVGDETHRIERLLRRPGGHEDFFVCQILDGEQGFDLLGDLRDLGQTSLPCGPACQFTGPRLQNGVAALGQTDQIFLHDGIGVHLVVHRRAEEYRCGRSEQGRGQQVVGNSRRQLADQVGRRRCDDGKFRKLRQRDMVHHEFAGPVKKVRSNTLARKGFKSQWGDEFTGMVRHDNPDLGAAPDQFPNQFGGLIGGDAAGNAQNDSSSLQHGQDLLPRMTAGDCRECIAILSVKIKQYLAYGGRNRFWSCKSIPERLYGTQRIGKDQKS